MTTHLVRLQLDVTDFDLARFQPYVDKCRTSGIRLTTLSEVGDTPENRRVLYDLNKECSADIPERGAFFTYDEYHRLRFEVPSYDPRGVVLALDGHPGDWCPPGVEIVAQVTGSFDVRLTAAWVATGGPGVQIGMDTPQVTPALLESCAEFEEAALGFALDGGWWALGLRDPLRAEVLRDVPMSRADTGVRTLTALLGMNVRTLPILSDVDTMVDARAVAGQAPGGRFAATLATIGAAVAR